ncbi:putative hydro-lyase [Acidisphaera rubrifaciens]|nr:putative hydro-lyase [Acidisphaera rubrifaciens]
MNQTAASAAAMTGGQTRADIRAGRVTGTTAGLAPGCIQANIAIVPAAVADDFALFCARNPRPCPLLARGAAGDPALPALGAGIDMRTDLPRYRVYRDGVAAEEVTDIAALWRDDLVTFAIGCSFTFEHALLSEGVPLRHVAQGRNVAMYRTRCPTEPAGPFDGPLVVSMRPFSPSDAERAARISARFPRMHGSPIHLGDPAALGIADLGRPDYGDAVEIHPGEVPLFWACGVTSQAALEAARLPLVIAHAPGCMLVTDLPHEAALA